MGLFGKLFSSDKEFNSDMLEIIENAYDIKGFYKTNIDWGTAVDFAKQHNSDDDIGIIGDGIFNINLNSEEVTVRFIKKPKNGTVVIMVTTTKEYKEQIEAMFSEDYDPSKYPTYKLEF
jgi:hypothetical protein